MYVYIYIQMYTHELMSIYCFYRSETAATSIQINHRNQITIITNANDAITFLAGGGGGGHLGCD